VTTRFTAETLTGQLARGAFPEVRRAMLEFVGRYLRDFERAAQAAGLTLAQSRVLGFVAAKPSSQREIAEQFGCDPSNIPAKINRLVASKLVARGADPGDGRVNRIHATPKGLAVSKEICDTRQWLAEVLGRLGPKDIETVRRALDLIIQSGAIVKADPDCAPAHERSKSRGQRPPRRRSRSASSFIGRR
jgi:DNA-binding MarR family transcriptional regulator